MAELVIYGRDSCGLCTKFKKDCEKEDLKYRWSSIEVAANKAEMSRKLRACSWFKGGTFGLPLVDMYGDMQSRPTVESVLAAKKALPSDSEVAKIKKQFKELDVDKDGTLSFEEMKKMLTTLSPKLSEVQLQKLFCAADVDQNGKVEMEEFIDFVLNGKQVVAKISQEPPQGTPSADGVRADWKKDVLAAHNDFRAEHGAEALTWSDECYLLAKKQANACQERSCMYHGSLDGPSGRHGQNIYWCSMPGKDAQPMVEAWYQELIKPGYDFEKATFTPGTGHFTQVVWKGTTQVGMALSEDGRFCVANYFPAGNMMGAFKKNVLPRGSPYAPKEEAPKPRAKAAPKPKAEAAGGGGDAAPAAGPTKVTAKAMTPELLATLTDCPFPYKEKIEQAFEKAGVEVSVARSEEGIRKTIEVTIKDGGCTSRMRGTWGGG
ncbi:Glipr2 [Symbiodinium natans]|uniref:Glipr2 protein n=1 Tax=Symbiodinium natans TaxID=878477 RepID=A0A812T9A9_9DINO|nr:Glipr2 [Symbiodinium natans]